MLNYKKMAELRKKPTTNEEALKQKQQEFINIFGDSILSEEIEKNAYLSKEQQKLLQVSAENDNKAEFKKDNSPKQFEHLGGEDPTMTEAERVGLDDELGNVIDARKRFGKKTKAIPKDNTDYYVDEPKNDNISPEQNLQNRLNAYNDVAQVQYLQNIAANENYSKAMLLAKRQEQIQRIIEVFKKHGIKITEKEAEKVLNNGFSSDAPYIMLTLSILKDLSEIPIDIFNFILIFVLGSGFFTGFISMSFDFFYGIIYFIWRWTYSGGINGAVDKNMKIQFFLHRLPRSVAMMIAEMIPFIQWLPMNALAVFSRFITQRRIAKGVQSILKE